MRILAVMPAYNEETRIAAAIGGVLPYVDGIVVVEDGSKDATYWAAHSCAMECNDTAKDNRRVVVLRHRVNRGQGAALKTGTQAALTLGADVIVHIDADGQHDPSFLPHLVTPIVSGEADVVYGSRYMGARAVGMPLSRRVLHVGIRQFNAWALGIPRTVTDPQSGLRALSAHAARSIQFHQDRMAHCSEILKAVTRSGLRWKEIPARVLYTQESLAKGQEGKGALQAALRIVWQLFIGSFR